MSDRAEERVIAALGRLWGRFGVPRRIQFGNGGPFTAPTGLGEVVRVCLQQHATPVFVPPREPWRNGAIEHFNDTFDKRFFRRERFTGGPHLAERADAFERFHNSQHCYSATGRRVPDETRTAATRDPLARLRRPRRAAHERPTVDPRPPTPRRPTRRAPAAPPRPTRSAPRRTRAPTPLPGNDVLAHSERETNRWRA